MTGFSFLGELTLLVICVSRVSLSGLYNFILTPIDMDETSCK